MSLKAKQLPARAMACACCGQPAGSWMQWWNQDRGFGICFDCVGWIRGRGATEEFIRDTYGYEGRHWGRQA